MTASPFSSEELFETSTTELEAVLDARIFTAPLGAREELLQVLKRPAELVVEYDQAPEWPVSLLTSQIIEACQGLEGVERTLQRAQRK